MPNIMINSKCNLNCTYCFANEVNMADMTLDDFKKAVAFCMRLAPIFNIIGGEPTIHPQFKVFLQYIIDNKRIETVGIFTNGVYLKKHLALLSRGPFRLSININHPADMGEKNHKKTLTAIDIFVKRFRLKSRIVPGITMYRPDFDYDYILKILTKYGFDCLRVSVNVPNTKERRGMSVLDYLREFKPRYMELLETLADRDILLRNDCNVLPKCLFTEADLEQIERLEYLSSPQVPYRNVGVNSVCTPAVDILPNLDVIRCFGLSQGMKVPMSRFDGVIEASRYFSIIYDNFAYQIPSGPECEGCIERENMACMGGCIGYKYEKINRGREMLQSM